MAYRKDQNFRDKKNPEQNGRSFAEKRNGNHNTENRFEKYRFNGSGSYGTDSVSARGKKSLYSKKEAARRDADIYPHDKQFHGKEYMAAEVKDPAEEKFILTGRNPIREALKTNRDLEKLLVQKGELSGSAMEPAR